MNANELISIRMKAYKLGFNDGVREGRNEVKEKVRVWVEKDQMDWDALKRLLVLEEEE